MIDAGFTWDDETAYFFSGNLFYRYEIGADAVPPGYPLPTAGEWNGWPPEWDAVDAAVMWPNGRIYFFRRGEYLAFDLEQDRVLPGYPQPIHGSWRGFPAHWAGVDSAVIWPNGRAYLFYGDEYLAYDVENDAVLPGYPKRTSTSWRGWPPGWDHVRAAVVFPNGRAYFFHGDEYLAFDIGEDRVVPGYPKPIAGSWRGLPVG